MYHDGLYQPKCDIFNRKICFQNVLQEKCVNSCKFKITCKSDLDFPLEVCSNKPGQLRGWRRGPSTMERWIPGRRGIRSSDYCNSIKYKIKDSDKLLSKTLADINVITITEKWHYPISFESLLRAKAELPHPVYACVFLLLTLLRANQGK